MTKPRNESSPTTHSRRPIAVMSWGEDEEGEAYFMTLFQLRQRDLSLRANKSLSTAIEP